MRLSATPRLATAALLALTLVACAKQQNLQTQSAGAGASAPASGKVVVAAKTDFYGKLDNEISTKKSHSGDKFTITHTDTYFHKNPALAGAVIEGHLENVQPAGLGKKPALTVVFEDVRMPDGTMAPIDVTLKSAHAFDAKTHHWRTLGMVIGAGAAGHMVAGKQHGGTAGAVGAYALSQQMKTDVEVKPGTVIEFVFNTDATASGTSSPGGQ